MASGVGGMGIHWATSCPRPHQSERIPFVPSDEMDAALDHAESLLGVSKIEKAEGLLGAIHDAVAAVFDGPGLTPTAYMPTASQSVDGGLRFSGSGVILGDIERSVAGFELRPETLAKRVLIENGVAVGAELEDRRTGGTYEVRAARVVVCADDFRTPQLLFASGIRPPALGHHSKRALPDGIVPHANGNQFDPDKYRGEGEEVPAPVLVPFSDARPIQGGVTALANSAYKLPMDLGDNARLGIIAWYGAKDIQFDDRIEFSESETDFYGMPRMSIHYSRSEKDLETIQQAEGELPSHWRSPRQIRRRATLLPAAPLSTIRARSASGPTQRTRCATSIFGCGGSRTYTSEETGSFRRRRPQTRRSRLSLLLFARRRTWPRALATNGASESLQAARLSLLSRSSRLRSPVTPVCRRIGAGFVGGGFMAAVPVAHRALCACPTCRSGFIFCDSRVRLGRPSWGGARL